MALGLPDDPAQQKRLLIGLLPLLVLFAYWYFLHGDFVTEVTEMHERVERLQTANATARARSTQSRQLEERLSQFERHIDRLEELVPRSEEVSQILNQINQRAEQVGVEVVTFRPGESSSGAHYSRRSFELSVRGTYHNVGRLLADIGSLPRIMTPVDFELFPRNQRDRSGGQQVEASFTIVTYVLPTEGAPAPGGTGA